MARARDANPNKRLLTTREAARYLGVGEERIREWTRLKFDPLTCVKLPRMRYPLYTREALEEFLLAHTE